MADRSSTPLTAPIPTTPHRTVRFQLDADTAADTWRTRDSSIDGDDYSSNNTNNGNDDEEDDNRAWVDQEDFMYSDDDDDFSSGVGRRRRNRDDSGHSTRAPLLTDREAPAVRVSMEMDAAVAEAGLENGRPKSGMGMAFFNMSNSIIGAGIIGQPYAFKQAGLGMGVFLLVTLTIVVNWTINLIVINSKLSGANSFQSTVSACFGRTGLIAISVAQWAFAFGGMIAFCIIIGDSIPHVLAAIFPGIENVPILSLLTNRRAVIILATLGISFPLSLYRDIAKLAKASAFALLSMLVIIFAVVTQGVYVKEEDKGGMSLSLWTVNTGVFQAIGVISFAFVCHHNSLLIYGSLRKPTLDRFATVTNYSTGISLVACLAMALSGFLTFKDKTEGNVLNNFPPDNVLVNIARLCFGLNMLTTLPLEAFVCREVMETYYYPTSPFSRKRHIIFTTSLVFTAMFLSLITCDLGAVFELIGATSACALAYILPPLCYIKMAKRSWKTIPAMGTVVFGGLVMGISVVQALVKIVGGGGEGKKCT